MFSLISAIVIIFVSWNSQQSMGYQWLPLKAGDPIPEGAILINPDLNTYVGRAKHYDLVLPAEIYNTTKSHALISSCSQEIVKNQFEILIATEHCEWSLSLEISEIPANVVRAGTAKNGEPIFIGRTKNYIPRQVLWNHYPEDDLDLLHNDYRIASIFITTNQIKPFKNSIRYPNQDSLICDDDSNWMDTSSAQIPNNTISGGKSGYDNEIFVARLLNNCQVVPGMVIPTLGVATGVYDGEEFKSSFCQVLVGNEDNYRWVSAENGEIPDYAVVAGKHQSNELMYVAKVNETLGYVLHSEALEYNNPYEILTKHWK